MKRIAGLCAIAAILTAGCGAGAPSATNGPSPGTRSLAHKSTPTSLTARQAFALAAKADSAVTPQWTENQWSPPWLVVSAPTQGDGSVTQGKIFLIEGQKATLVHTGSMIPHLVAFPIPGHRDTVLGLGKISACVASGPYAVGLPCADSYTNVLILTSQWPFIVLHLQSLPVSASTVTVPGSSEPGVDMVMYTPEQDSSGSLTGWNVNQPWLSVVAQWDSASRTLVVDHVGLSVESMTPLLAQGLGYSGQGVYLAQTSGPAAQDDIPTPSIITAVNGTPAAGVSQLILAFSRSPLGTSIRLTVWHGGNTTTYAVRPDVESVSQWLSAELY